MLTRTHSVLPASIEAHVEATIGCAIEVHRRLGAGFLEGIYHEAMAVELEYRSIAYRREVEVPVEYRGRRLKSHRLDLVVEQAVVVELKAVDRLDAVHEAQLISYLKASGLRVGLLVNFRSVLLKQGLRRLVL